MRVTESGFKRLSEAADWLAEQRVKLNIGGINDSSQTFREYLKWWLARKKDKLSPKTHERYQSLEEHANRALGDVPLSSITAMALEDLYSDLRLRLSARTVRHVHGMVHAALNGAIKYKLLRFNPADGCELETVVQTEAPSLDPDEVAAFMTKADGSWVGVLIRLGADTGARRGELLGLKWPDLNETTGVLRIARAIVQVKGKIKEKETKGKRTRPVTLSPNVLACLRMHREQQLSIREQFGDAYADLDLIFADYEKRPGWYLLPSSVSRACVRIGKKAGLSKSGLHILRHSNASILLSNGVPLPVVSKRLGHADVYTTAKIYSHALPRDEKAAAAIWERVMHAK
jgi:integrase